MIKYLVAASETGGLADAERRGWQRLARGRFATAERDDVRLVWRKHQVILDPAGPTVFVKAADFDAAETPDTSDFEELVSGGFARWEE
jgi:hypothetical protein